MAVLKLKKEIEINGKKTNEIEYDVDSLTGVDCQNAVKELGKRGMVVTVNETDQNYHAMLFSIASDISFEDMQRLGAKDYAKACNAVRDFFLEE